MPRTRSAEEGRIMPLVEVGTASVGGLEGWITESGESNGVVGESGSVIGFSTGATKGAVGCGIVGTASVGVEGWKADTGS